MFETERPPSGRPRGGFLGAACGLVLVCAALGATSGGGHRHGDPALAPAFLKTTSILSDRPVPPARQSARLSLLLAADVDASAAPAFLGETVSREVETLPAADDTDTSLSETRLEQAADDRAHGAAEQESAPPRAPEDAAASPTFEPHVVAAQPATPPDAPPAPARAGTETLDPRAAEMIRLARERAEACLRIGDIFGMRLFLERAARLGSHEAQLRLAQSYDEKYLAAWGVRGVRPDAALADALYEEANAARLATQGH